MPLWLLNIAGWAWAHKKIAGTLLLALFVFGWASIHYLCGESRTEKRIDARTGEIVGSNVEIQQADVNANVAVDKAVNIEVKANKVRHSKPQHVTANEAQKNLCSIYPDDPGCSK